MTTLRTVGELEMIRRLTKRLGYGPDVVVGVGDDCAVLRPKLTCGFDLLLTSDAVTEGVHFAPETPGEKIGHKAVGRVLSDIAAMGGEPLWALVNIGAPGDCRMKRLQAFYRGAERLARRHGMSIVGGDSSEAPVLTAHVFAVGIVPSGRAVLRSGARVNDLVFVTGVLGGSISGKHLRFEPRVREGRMLRDWATAMIDLSDGLATDLRHILRRSRVGAQLTATAIPISLAARRCNDGRSALEHALCDGEDFELLFTIPPEREKNFVTRWRKMFKLPCSRIGVITARAGRLELVDGEGTVRGFLKGMGFQHFANDKTRLLIEKRH